MNRKWPILFLLLLISLPLQAQDINALKAAYVYYFSKFISWENTDNNNEMMITICFDAENDSVDQQFFSLAEKNIGNKRLNIIKVESDINPKHCHVLYQDTPNSNNPGKSNPSALIVTNNSTSQGDIRFIISNNKLGFVIDNGQLQEKNLKVSSRLLRLAAEVIQ